MPWSQRADSVDAINKNNEMRLGKSTIAIKIAEYLKKKLGIEK